MDISTIQTVLQYLAGWAALLWMIMVRQAIVQGVLFFVAWLVVTFVLVKTWRQMNYAWKQMDEENKEVTWDLFSLGEEAIFDALCWAGINLVLTFIWVCLIWAWLGRFLNPDYYAILMLRDLFTGK